jgi:precorrin-2/cobalt-factor-2 C20-methyltransferase
MTVGHLYGIGVGPGDPELMTRKAHRLVQTCPVVAHFAAIGRPGNAWTTVAPLLRPGQSVLRLEYPVTTEPTTAADYERLLDAFYDASAALIEGELAAGRDVAVVCEGDPFFYGSYMYLHERLARRYPTTVVPGVTSFSAAAAAAGTPLVSREETLTVIPGLKSPVELAGLLRGADAAVLMKVGARLVDIRSAAAAAGVDGDAVYVERASCADERVLPLAETAEVDAPYFSVVLVPGRALAQRGVTESR